MKKLIMLDIDGVLVTWNSIKRFGLDSENRAHFDKRCVKNLNRLIKETGAEIVVSSTWRCGTLENELQRILDRNGVKGKVIGKTPMTSRPRGEEIKLFLAAFNEGREEPVKILILDDDNDFTMDQQPFHVRSNMDDGLTKELTDQAIQILGRIK